MAVAEFVYGIASPMHTDFVGVAEDRCVERRVRPTAVEVVRGVTGPPAPVRDVSNADPRWQITRSHGARR